MATTRRGHQITYPEYRGRTLVRRFFVDLCIVEIDALDTRVGEGDQFAVFSCPIAVVAEESQRVEILVTGVDNAVAVAIEFAEFFEAVARPEDERQLKVALDTRPP